jgi:putative phosphoesterase
MLIAIIADTHLPRGRRRLPGECVEAIRRSDLVLHAGDVSTATALAELRAIGPPVAAIHGNVDDPRLHRKLPDRVELVAEEVVIGMVHDAGPAAGRLARLRRLFPRADAVIFGHSHVPLHREVEGFHIFNPGSPTERRRAAHRAMGLAEVRGRRIGFRHLELS